MGEAKRDVLPSYSESAAEGDRGVRLVQRLVGDELGWIFRDESKIDFGIDAILEVVEGGKATGRLIGVQIKSGPSYFKEPTTDDNGFVFRGQEKHLNYWLDHSLPVILVICDPGAGEAFYAEINTANTRPTEKGWTTVIGRDRPFNASAEKDLKRLANDPQRADLIELSLLMFLIDRWGNRLEVVNIIDLPRDWYWFPYMIVISGETGGRFAVGFIDTALQTVDREVVAEEEKWRHYIERSCGTSELMLFFVGDEPATTRPTIEAIAYLEEHPLIHPHRLIYRAPRDLDEIDENERLVTYWPGDDKPWAEWSGGAVGVDRPIESRGDSETDWDLPF